MCVHVEYSCSHINKASDQKRDIWPISVNTFTQESADDDQKTSEQCAY